MDARKVPGDAGATRVHRPRAGQGPAHRTGAGPGPPNQGTPGQEILRTALPGMPAAGAHQHGLQPTFPGEPRALHGPGLGGDRPRNPRRGVRLGLPRRGLALKLRGALLGAGNIALRRHAPQWASGALGTEVEIVAVADLSACNREDARAFCPRSRTYEQAEELLQRESLDFCDICTPPFTHRLLVEESSRRGLHLVCEKPLASSPEDADRIARAVREAGVVFQPCHQYHYSPQWQAAKRLLPRIGHVYLAECAVHRLGPNPGNPNWEPQWRTDRSRAGGGILVDHGAHIFYQLRAVLGEPETVQATVRTLLHHGYEVEDTAFVTLDFGEGLAQVSLTWAARRREIHYRFVGERGEITGDDQRVSLHGDTREEIAFTGGISQDSSHSEWYAPLLQDFTDRVRRSDAGTEALDEAVYVTRLISRAYESSEQGRALSLTPPEAEEPEAESLAYALATMDAPDSR